MDRFEEEHVINIDCAHPVFAAATKSSIRIYNADFSNLSAWQVTPALQPIKEIRFDESAQYLAVVGPRSVGIFNVKDGSTYFDLDGNGDDLVGLRFHGGAIFMATVAGHLLMFKRPEEETASEETESGETAKATAREVSREAA